MKKRTSLLLTFISSIFAQEATLIEENPGKQWLTNELKNKSAPEWVRNAIQELDPKIQDETARKYFRRFLADPSTRSDAVTKFVEYLSLGKNEPDTIYKAVYYALTYTIMDGLPTGPLRAETPQEPETPVHRKNEKSNEPNAKPLNNEEKEEIKLLTSPQLSIGSVNETLQTQKNRQIQTFNSGTNSTAPKTNKIRQYNDREISQYPSDDAIKRSHQFHAN